MAYKKYARKRTYKKRSNLRKSTIFGKKSAKSQAKQIYALNKKINRIEKQTRPENLIYLNHDATMFHQSFAGDASKTETGVTYQYPLFTWLNSLQQSSEEYFPFNNSISRIQNVKLFFNFRRTIGNNIMKDVIGRITIMKLSKVSSFRDQEYIHYTSGLYPYLSGPVITRSEYMENIVYNPLNFDISSQGKIVYDYKFKMPGGDNTKLTLNKSIKLYGVTLRRGDNNVYPDCIQNDYVVCVSFGYSPLNKDQASQIDSSDVICSKCCVKAVFVDEALNSATPTRKYFGEDFSKRVKIVADQNNETDQKDDLK